MRLKTNAQITSEKIDAMMRDQVTLPISWQYLSGGLEMPIILETTFDEIILYLNNDNYMRPGYDFSAEKLQISILFAKVNYRPSSYNKLTEDSDTCLIFKNDTIKSLLNDYTSTNTRHGFKNKISSLKSTYQVHLMDCVAHLIDSSEDYFKSCYNVNEEMILHILCKINNDVFALYNNCDLQYRGPRIVLDLSTYLLNIEESIALLFLNRIGFDVIVINHDGKADIENYIVASCLNVYYAPKGIENNATKLFGKPLWQKFGIAACVILLGFSINWMFNDKPADEKPLIENTSSLTSNFLLNNATEKIEVEKIDTTIEVTHASNTPESTDVEEVLEDEEVINDLPDAYRSQMFHRVPVNYSGGNQYKLRLIYEAYDQEIQKYGVDAYGFNSVNMDKLLSPNVYIYKHSYEEIGIEVHATKKFAVDGTYGTFKLGVGDSYQLEIIRSGSKSTYVSSRLKDVFDNDITFSVLDHDGYIGAPVMVVATNKATNVKSDMALINKGIPFDLEDGRYTIELADVFPQNEYDIELATTDLLVKDGKLYYERNNNNAVVAIEDELEFYCNYDDVFIIDLDEIFSDADGDMIYYDVSIKSDYNDDPSGFYKNYYFNKITSEYDMKFTLYATDMYGETARKKVLIHVVKEDIPEESYR